MIIIATCAMLLTFVAAVFMNSVQAQTTECVQLLDSPSAVNDSWDGSCLSENPPIGGEGERHARFFVFALETETEIAIELSSDDQDAYLYVLKGWGKSGEVFHFNDDIERHGSTDSRIQATLEPGLYTIEGDHVQGREEGQIQPYCRWASARNSVA